ncbi:hypothetical protein FQA39_LY04497 [Lamprigera yunnana]|nr:hypothetical protein FQA39_LY04497 [Lamprigera yunnana]
MCCSALSQVTNKTIVNCFRKEGFIKEREDVEPVDEENAWDYSMGITFNKYITFDKNIAVCGKILDVLEEILNKEGGNWSGEEEERKLSFIYAFSIFLTICLPQNVNSSADFHKYLNDLEKITNNKLDNIIENHIVNEELQLDVEFKKILNFTIPNTKVGRVSIYESNCVVVNGEIYEVLFENNFLLYKSATETFKFTKTVNLVRVTKYNDYKIFILSTTNKSNIYIKNETSSAWIHIQSIGTASAVSDLCFFINRKNLYLLVLNSEQHTSTYSKVYKWTGTHFDEIDSFLTKGALSVSTFQDKNSEIIIVLENREHTNKSDILVFEFSKNSLKKSQLMLTNNCRHIVSYVFKTKQFLTVFEESNINILYEWNGFEFVQISEFNGIENIEKILLTYLQGIPVVFILQKGGLSTFYHHNNNWMLITKINFYQNFDEILDATIMMSNNVTHLLIFAKSKEKDISYMVLPFVFHVTPTDDNKQLNEVYQCMLNLETVVKNYTVIQHFEAPINKKIVQSSNQSYKNTLLASAAQLKNKLIVIDIDVPDDVSSINKSLASQVTQIWKRIKDINEKVLSLQDKINSLYCNGSLWGNLLIKGNLYINQMDVKLLSLNKINDIPWNPNTWLSYSKPQNITGSVVSKNLRVIKLNVPQDKVFQDINVNNTYNFKSLRTNNIYVNKVNDIEFEDIYIRSSPSLIRGVKHFENIMVNETNISFLNKENGSDVFLQLINMQSKNIMFSLNVNIENFNFAEINGINWKKFNDSLFRTGVATKIIGNLSVSSLKCNKIRVKKINNVDASSLVTSTTPQNLSSVIHWKTILADNIICNRINNISFDDIIFPNNLAIGPVSIDNSFVHGNLHINYVHEDLDKNGVEHVIGTDISDLLQIYGHIKLVGKLHLQNISIFNEAKVFINDQEFDEDLSKQYWSKSKNQTVPSFFEAQNGITTTTIFTNYLNNLHLSKYFLNSLNDKLPINWVFKNVVIFGDVSMNPFVQHYPDIQQLDLLSVKLNGWFNITGQKHIKGRVRVKNLVANYLDGIKVADVVNENVFENVLIKGDLISKNISADIVNNVILKDLENAVLFTDRDAHINKVWCQNIRSKNINVSYMNLANFNDHLQSLNQLYSSIKLQNMKVNGNVRIVNMQDLMFINGYKVDNFVTKETAVQVFKQPVKFLHNINVENMEVAYINNVNIDELTEKLLYTEWDQNITAVFTFDHLNTPNMFVPKINEFLVQSLIDIKNKEIQALFVHGTLHINYPAFWKSVNAENLLCDIQYAVNTLQNPPTRLWNSVHVTKNVTLWDYYCNINVITKEAVQVKKNSAILAPVIFKHHVFANNVLLEKSINNVHLNDIFTDALLKDAGDQIITGHNVFHKMAISSAVANVAYIPTVNNIDIQILNESIIESDNIYNTVIKGHKQFYGGLQTNKLIVSSISDLNPLNLVNLNSLSVIPKTYFYSLEVENSFNTVIINDQNFSDFMLQRLLRHTKEEQTATGTYYIDNAVLAGNTHLPLINDLIIDDIVFDVDLQIINAPKYFMSNAFIHNNLINELLNGKNLSMLYENSILHGKENFVKGCIKFNNVSMFSDIETEKINGISVDEVTQLLRATLPIKDNLIQTIAEKTDYEISASVKYSKEMSDNFLYLEQSNQLQLFLPNITSGYSYNTKDTVMLYLTRHNRGSMCGLADVCMCPTQHILQVTNKESVNTIVQSNNQRVFGYEGEGISVHLFTNGISTNEACRTNNVDRYNENVTLMWMTYSPDGAVDHFYFPENLLGYISGVQFFTYAGNTFIVVAKYYDPISNTHDVPCLVWKISKETGDVQLIQSIPGESTWVVHLFYTAQGIVLILGSLETSITSNDNLGVAAYWFDENTEQFKLMRKVSSNGCSSVVGIALGSDSLFVVAYRDAPLQVFKYHPKYNNYYFAQNIFTDATVTALSLFYGGYTGLSEPYLCIVTDNGNFHIYSYRYIQGWQILSSGELDGIQVLVPFKLVDTQYLFASSNKASTVLNVIKHGLN